YLLSYNFLSLLGWTGIFILGVTQLLTGHTNIEIFETTWPVLVVVQTTALFEIVHVILGWVRSPLMTTVMQVFSRIFLVWCVNYPFPAIHGHWSYITMILSWSVAEMVRYSHYATHLLSAVPEFITWARYTFFLVLYPTGISSELIMTLQALPYIKEQWGQLYYYLYILVLVLYIPGSPVMFNHMRVQRIKYFKGKTQ
ncbi:tyrosine phosphatase-like protein, partial [Pilobolus umbonatus]